jgi:hypothetical protein
LAAFLNDKLEPKVTNFKTLIAEPNRPKLRVDKLDPKAQALKIETVEPNRHVPYTLIALDNLAQPRTLKLLPIEANCSTLNAPLTLVADRIDIELPQRKVSYSDTGPPRRAVHLRDMLLPKLAAPIKLIEPEIRIVPLQLNPLPSFTQLRVLQVDPRLK